MSRRIVTIDAFPDGAFRHLDADAIVCIDVMLSTTTLLTAVALGQPVFVAPTQAAARDLSAATAGSCLMGTDDGEQPEGFNARDSPSAVAQRPLQAPLVLWSPPGTELLVNAGPCRRVLVACFRNLTATARQLAGLGRVALLGAGCREEFSCEDQMAAAWIGARLARDGFEPGDRRTAAMIGRWSEIDARLAGWGNSAEGLRRMGAVNDLEFVLGHVDDLGFACEYRPSGEVSACHSQETRSGAAGWRAGTALAAGGAA
ncbi:MAG TPA: 2-phosphosulfolactate phosphatase [Vicinamibacteria bacterium]|nr:2-phosphosulfolactate phosphatase [Vicinamibacteria bacterium]